MLMIVCFMTTHKQENSDAIILLPHHVSYCISFKIQKTKSCLGKAIWPYRYAANSQKVQMKMKKQQFIEIIAMDKHINGKRCHTNGKAYIL